MIHRHCLAFILLVTTLVSASSCGREPAPAEASGQVSLALRATGPDGRTYRLPPSSFFSVDTATTSFLMDLGTGEPALVFPLQAGSYIGRARDSSTGADPSGVSWQLLQVDATGSPQPVPATLHDPDVPFQVVAGHSTQVLLRFTVHGVGDVVFQTGQVNVSIAVNQDVVSAGGIALSGSLRVTSQSREAGEPLDQVLAAPAGAEAPLTITARLAGPWQHHFEPVCNNLVDVEVTVGGDHFGMRSWLSELNMARGGSICINTAGHVLLSIDRSGPATSSLAGILSGSHRFQLTIFGFGPAAAWDGTTLALSGLSQPTALMRAGATVTLSQTASPFAELASTSFEASLVLRFVP